MSSVAPTASVPLPAEVVAFAHARGVAAYLPAALAITEQVFPMARHIRVALEEDPEIPDERHIAFEVELAGLDLGRYAELHWEWDRKLFEVCPAPRVCSFGLHLDIRDP